MLPKLLLVTRRVRRRLTGAALLLVLLLVKARITVLALVLNSRDLLSILSLLVLASIRLSFILSNNRIVDIIQIQIFKRDIGCNDGNLHLPFRRKSGKGN